MMDIDVTTTLAELVDAHPDLARELEQRQLDYCCGGATTLADACVRAGLDPEVVAEQLSLTAGRTEPAVWTTMAADELVDHLEATHHRYLWDELPRITALIDKIVSVHGERHPELAGVAACFAEVRADLEPHLIEEERTLFPLVRELARPAESPGPHSSTLQAVISLMLREHDPVGDLLARLRTITDGHTPPADGCATYDACFAAFADLEADTHLHIHKENNVLVPLVVRLEAGRATADVSC